MNPSRKEFNFGRFLRDVIVDVCIVFVLVILIRTFVFAPFRVHGPSMCDTFNFYENECFSGDGEYVLAIRLNKIERGDVVIFEAPGDNKEFFIKRVIGMPGDIVKIDNGKVYLENEKGIFQELEEPYLNEENQDETRPYRKDEELFEVPEDSYFVMGDNRNKSSDSRRCFNQLGCTDNDTPFLGKEAIEGDVKLVIFPLTHIRWISETEYSV